MLLSSAFHPQTDGQAERTIQTLEDMLRACALDFKGSWDDHLPLIMFAYNNNFHSIGRGYSIGVCEILWAGGGELGLPKEG